MSEGKGEIAVKAEIPGGDAKDIDVKLEGRLLTISGEKKPENESRRLPFHGAGVRLDRRHVISPFAPR